MLQGAFGDWFGGATPLPSQGVWRMHDGRVLLDKGQTVVLSMTTKARFLKFRARVEELVDRVGDLLKQEAMAVIAFRRSDGFLVIGE